MTINRLHKTKDIENVHNYGRVFFTRQFSIKYLRNSLKKIRLAIICSTKVSKRAVVRNRARRVVREYLRQNLKSSNDGYDIIIVITKGSLDDFGGVSAQTIRESLRFALKKVSL